VIVDDPSPHELGSRRHSSGSKHERSAGLAERVRHGLAGRGRLGLREDGQVVLSASEAGVGIESGKVGCEHGCRDLSAVRAVADEGVGEAWLLQGLFICQLGRYARITTRLVAASMRLDIQSPSARRRKRTSP
jgi:hypothetical protein